MNSKTRVAVKNTSKHRVVGSLPDIRFRRVWTPNSTFKVPFEVLEEAVYDVGFRKLMDQGVLFVEDEAVRIELGLQEEGQEYKVKILSRAQMLKMLKVDSLAQMEKALIGINKEQIVDLAELAINETVLDVAKAKLIKEKCGINIIKGIELKMKNEEVIKDGDSVRNSL